MELKDFMNSKGLGMEAVLHVTHRRDNGIHTLKIADMLEEYHQAKLKLLGIANVVGQSEQFNCFLEDSEQGERCETKCKDCKDYEGVSN